TTNPFMPLVFMKYLSLTRSSRGVAITADDVSEIDVSFFSFMWRMIVIVIERGTILNPKICHNTRLRIQS
ncbi:MAG: hypothetical protein HW399_859, partial [Dehalococcoidia bacterium]|nr:hypothetical protein [Dehalococcoidia bacterium]